MAIAQVTGLLLQVPPECTCHGPRVATQLASVAAERTLDPSAPQEPDELGELSHDAITASFRIWQRVRGHRYSLDDVLTAWEAAEAAPTAQRCLELGSGIGSVLLMLAYKLP